VQPQGSTASIFDDAFLHSARPGQDWVYECGDVDSPGRRETD